MIMMLHGSDGQLHSHPPGWASYTVLGMHETCYFFSDRRDVSCLAADLPGQGQPVPSAPASRRADPFTYTQAFSAALLAHTCFPGADSSALDPPTRAQGSRELTLNTQPRLHCQHSQPRSPHPLTHLLPPVSPRLWGPPRLPSFPPPLPGLDSVYNKMEWSPPVSPPTFPIPLSPHSSL